MAPSVYKISKRKNRTLQEALNGNTWIKDLDLLHPSFSAQLFVEFVQLWKIVQQVNLRLHTQDEIAWKFSESGQFSTSSAYHAQFLGRSAQTSTKSSGRLGHLQNANSSASLRFKIESGQWTDYMREVGHTTRLVYFATGLLRLECTSSPNAGSLGVFGWTFLLG